MHLRRLEIQGFKTFAQHTVLEFHSEKTRRGVTGVVGPNGSGKSNIADALRWVMGEQSLKLLRSKKSEDVIFSGTPKKPRSGFAEVHMTLENDGHSDIDLPEVLISRRLYRDGQSEYEINKKQVRLTDVVMLLAQCGIGQRTYSVIGQGMVDAVLVSTPAERKEFFDEAAGLRPFQLKRHASVVKLEGTEENIKQADMLLREIEPRLASLEKQAKRLEQRETLETELKSIEHQYFGSTWNQISAGLIKASDIVTKVKRELESKTQEAEKIENEFHRLEKAESDSEKQKKARAALDALRDERSIMREKKIRLESKIEIASQVAKASNDTTWSPLPLSKIIEEIESIFTLLQNKNFSSAATQCTSLIAKLQCPAPEIREIKKVSTFDVELKQIADSILHIGEKITEAEKALSALNAKEDEGRKELFALQHKISSKRNEVQATERILSDASVEMARLESRKQGFFNELRQFAPGLEQDLDSIAKKNLIQGNDDESRIRMNKLRSQLEWIGGIEPETITEYHETKKRFEELHAQTQDLKEAVISLENIIAELDKTIKERADVAFKQLDHEFGVFFKKLFNGGDARILKLEDVEKEGEEGEEIEMVEGGIEIQATPPGKRLKSVNLLSGGERALTSIALICAIMAVNPSPFVVLDEVDAALDEANSRKFADIIDSLANKTQFVVVTHNRATMNKANELYGITMGDDGVSQLLSVKL